MKNNKDQVISDLKRKLYETTDQLKLTIQKKNIMESKLSQELKSLQSVQKMNNQAENSFWSQLHHSTPHQSETTGNDQ